MTTPVMDEFGLIARYFAPLATAHAGAFGLTDDAAVLDVPSGRQLVVTTDTIVAGIHFLPDDPAADVGVKALAVNLSDLAAMGAAPVGYTLALTLAPASDVEAWVAGIAAGLAESQARFGISLIGGDTVLGDGAAALTVTAIGTVPRGQALRRSTAQAGNDIYVSGNLGDAAFGLAAVRGGCAEMTEAERAWLISRYRRPEPRLALGQALLGVATAAADVSDGLVADLGHICRASGVSARLHIERIPVSALVANALERDPPLIDLVIAHGDDYELVFTAPSQRRKAIMQLSERLGLSPSRIGEMEARVAPGSVGPVTIVDPAGEPLGVPKTGYRHF